jgi:hypothetical protein
MRKLFSERNGLSGVSQIAQIDSLDRLTRNSLWNLCQYYRVIFAQEYSRIFDNENTRPSTFQIYLISSVLCLKESDFRYGSTVNKLIEKIFDSGQYATVFDILECLVEYDSPGYGNDGGNLFKEVNKLFEKFNVGYRFVNGEIVQVTNPIEIEAIEESLNSNFIPDHVKKHLANAVSALSPGAQNPVECIRESLNAVESAAKLFVDDENAVLSQALKKIKVKHQTHTLWISAMENLYNFSSDEGGLRHGSKGNDPNVDIADARLALVICSSMCSWLMERASK